MITGFLTDALATFRLTRLVTEDVVLDKPRDAILDWATKGTCTATLDGELCQRPGGHSGQHQRDTAATRVNWTDEQDSAEPADPALRLHPKVAEFIVCPWCVGAWVAFGVVAARSFAPRAWRPVAQALAFSAITGVMAEKV